VFLTPRHAPPTPPGPLFWHRQAWIALEAANAFYALEEVSLYGARAKPDWFWKLNPKGEVPVLVVETKSETVVLADSDLILDRIGLVVGGDKRRQQCALTIPSEDNPEAHAKIQAFREKLREFLPIGKTAVLGGHSKEMWTKLQELNALIDGPFVVGADLTIADCAGFPFLWRIGQEFGRWEDHGCTQIEQWLIECEKQAAFQKSIQRSWWWWW
jgi:glutathione S-transferase